MIFPISVRKSVTSVTIVTIRCYFLRSIEILMEEDSHIFLSYCIEEKNSVN